MNCIRLPNGEVRYSDPGELARNGEFGEHVEVGVPWQGGGEGGVLGEKGDSLMGLAEVNKACDMASRCA